jgi:hypothetical protein
MTAVLVACGGAATTTAPGGSDEPTGAAPTESGAEPTSSDASAEPSDEPTDSPATSDEPVDTPEPTASAEASEAPSPEPTPSGGTAAVCAGNADNRDFLASVADVMAWSVYCPVLPGGWFVDKGSYRQANGGHMEIGYKGSGGRHIELSEGSFCDDADGCVPDGTDAGDAAFGDQTGSLVATADGGWAIVVDKGEQPSWLLVGTGMDETAFRKIAADLIVVSG